MERGGAEAVGLIRVMGSSSGSAVASLRILGLRWSEDTSAALAACTGLTDRRRRLQTGFPAGNVIIKAPVGEIVFFFFFFLRKIIISTLE